MNSNISVIEIFPNELFEEIFQYISSYDLFNGFYDLNFRFSSLVKSQNDYHLTLVENWDNEQTIIPFFAPYITTLIIEQDQFVNFVYFPNIRSLKLCRPTAQQCNAIVPHILHNLQHLYISNVHSPDPSEQLCRLIFSSSFPHLRVCQIDRMILNNFPSNPSLSLSQLTISPNTWKTNMFLYIFHAYPNLHHLRITNLETICFPLIPYSIPIHQSVRSIFLHYTSIKEEFYNQLDWILSTTPSLKTFFIHIDKSEIDIEFLFVSLSQILVQRVPYLIRFKVKISFDDLSLFNLNNINHFRRIFSNVQFKYNVHENNTDLLILCDK